MRPTTVPAQHARGARLLAAAWLLLASGCGQPSSPEVTLAATYLGDPGRTGFYPGEAWLTPSSAPRLALSWTAEAGGSTSSQPVVANDLVYWGSWDGYEHATRLNGTPAWSTYVGRTADSRVTERSLSDQ